MALFAKAVRERIGRDGIIIKDDAHFEELYVEYRDKIFMERHGMTFLEWKTWTKTQPKRNMIWKKFNKQTKEWEPVEEERYNTETQKWETVWSKRTS